MLPKMPTRRSYYHVEVKGFHFYLASLGVGTLFSGMGAGIYLADHLGRGRSWDALLLTIGFLLMLLAYFLRRRLFSKEAYTAATEAEGDAR